MSDRQNHVTRRKMIVSGTAAIAGDAAVLDRLVEAYAAEVSSTNRAREGNASQEGLSPPVSPKGASTGAWGQITLPGASSCAADASSPPP